MNNIDKQYTDLLQDILDNGVEKETRNGGTISVFGRQIRHKMSDGFPLLTTKKMAWKTMVTELLWFLRGDTNIKYLVDNDCHIWDGDTYKHYVICTPTPPGTPVRLTKEEFINKIKTDDEFAKKWGELGPIYGKQWRSWGDGIMDFNTGERMYIDQIQNLINELKTNPDSRRLMVNAWNVGELDQMVLPPCHYGFQVYTRELSLEEMSNWFNNNVQNGTKWYVEMLDDKEFLHDMVVEYNAPTRAISLMWNQRSVDTFLGLPFNIASYGLLLEIIAKEVNMVPDELIGNLGDVHLYSNHVEQAKEQIGRKLTVDERMDWWYKNHKPNRDVCDDVDTYSPYAKGVYFDSIGVPKTTREPYPLPTLKINPNNEMRIGGGIFTYVNTDFTLENYQSHPTIKAPLSN
jgi:thymidylate synthase